MRRLERLAVKAEALPLSPTQRCIRIMEIFINAATRAGDVSVAKSLRRKATELSAIPDREDRDRTAEAILGHVQLLWDVKKNNRGGPEPGAGPWDAQNETVSKT